MSQKLYLQGLEEVSSSLQTDLIQGLTEEEPIKRLEIFGKNELPEPKLLGVEIVFLRHLQALLFGFYLLGILVFS